jgi:hypothetical protein
MIFLLTFRFQVLKLCLENRGTPLSPALGFRSASSGHLILIDGHRPGGMNLPGRVLRSPRSHLFLNGRAVHIPDKGYECGCTFDLSIATNDAFEDSFYRAGYKAGPSTWKGRELSANSVKR